MSKQYPDKYAVDENDNIVGEMQIEEIIKKGLYRRASRVYVLNESGKVLIQRRGKSVISWTTYRDKILAP
jgi:isopentenyldiphosphate isomerase